MTTVQRLLASICCLLLVSISHAELLASLPADIAPQPLAQALVVFARETGLQLGYESDIAATLESKGARATASAEEALTQLLDGTGLRFESLNDRTVRIYAAPVASSRSLPKVSAPTIKRPEGRSEPQPVTLGQTVVTATRREEQVNHVPMSIAVWTQEAMEASGVKGMTEIGALTPGVEFNLNSGLGDFFTYVVIRGVEDTHDATTGIFVDDTRLPTVRGDTYLRAFPFTFDLNRVEVLRGPQGTLLGEGTEGGAVRFITNQPSLTTFDGLARTEFAMTAHGDPSYEFGAAAGGPMIPDVLGFRVSGWYRSDGGYVDRVDPFTGVTVDDNANQSSSESFRGALTWAATDSLRVTPSLTYQSVGIRDPASFYASLSNPKAGELRSGNLLQRPYDDSFYLASLKLTAGFRATDLSTVTSYFDRATTATLEVGAISPVDYSDAIRLQADLKQRVFSEEIRLTSIDPTAALTWVTGLWYSDESNRLVSSVDAWDAREDTVTDRTQLAGFGQVDLKVTKHLAASAGLRIEHLRSVSITEGPPLSRAEVAQTSMAPRFDLSYQVDEGLLYLSLAKGYGGGGTAAAVLNGCETPIRYPPNTIWSFEIGAKNVLWDGRVQLDTSVFHIQWNNEERNPDQYCIGDTGGGGPAVSNGFDLAALALLTEHVKAGLAVAYTDAHYTQSVKQGDVTIIHEGDAVTGASNSSPPWGVTASIEYELALASGVIASVRAEDVFHSRNPGPFLSDYPDSTFSGVSRGDPSTNLLNLRADARWSSFEVALFINNALNSQPALMGMTPPSTATTFRPRTAGVTASWRF